MWLSATGVSGYPVDANGTRNNSVYMPPTTCAIRQAVAPAGALSVDSAEARAARRALLEVGLVCVVGEACS